ncbi:hypothetical protein ABT024_06970 [Streptomyces sp. NPDC002812]|uniref:hypothetical protein n=1 Tax=Streptomyces sp. NPDC002812 TaxID=3154434 RepID=UPI0033289383
MADEDADEAGRTRLVEMKLASETARAAATAGGYSAEAWRPWLDAAAAFGAAVTEHAKEHGLNRFELEAKVSKRALHPE